MTSLLTLYLRGKIKIIEKDKEGKKRGKEKNSKKDISEKINNKYTAISYLKCNKLNFNGFL